MKQRRINAALTIAALALTALLILTALPLAGTAAPRLERQPLESLAALNSTEATERGAPLSAFSAPSVASVVQSPGTTTRVSAALRSTPVMFIKNVGQFDDRVRFQVRGGMGTMWLAEDAIWITIIERSQVDTLERFDVRHTNVEREDEPRRGVNLKLSFPGANPNPHVEPFDHLDTVVSYFIGNNPDQWHPDVPVWGGVRYVDLYPGVDLVVGASAQAGPQESPLPWRLEVRDGADLSIVHLRVEGADAMILDGDRLRLTTTVGDFTLPLFQLTGGPDANLPCPTLVDNEVASPLAAMDVDQQSSIPNPHSTTDNPDDLLYATFLGGSDDEYGYGIALDGAGHAYVTGHTDSADFPVVDGPGYDTSHNGNDDAFIVALDASGTALRYVTFLGGSAWDYGYGIAVDRAGQAYVAGRTYSADFPAALGPGYDTSHNGNGDAFVVALDASGTALRYATFLGGSNREYGFGIAVDNAGQAYVTGRTNSPNFPAVDGPGYDTSHNGYYDAFVVALDASGTALRYATFLGGTDFESSGGIAVDGAGQAYIMGYTGSENFPAVDGPGYDTSHNGYYDAFVVALDTSGTALRYATFLGGNEWDWAGCVAVDGAGQAYVTGGTNSADFPAVNGPGYDTSFSGDENAFVVALDASGTALRYATFLGGSAEGFGYGIAVDGAGQAYVTGRTNSADFPAVDGPGYDTSHNGYDDAFIVALDASGTALRYATFLGGSDLDWGHSIAVDRAGQAYVMGRTDSADFPAVGGPGYDTSHNGYDDAFVAKLAVGPEKPDPKGEEAPSTLPPEEKRETNPQYGGDEDEAFVWTHEYIDDLSQLQEAYHNSKGTSLPIEIPISRYYGETETELDHTLKITVVQNVIQEAKLVICS